ncbi:MAG: TAXI family TRAP transporter solute-binding subunit [Pseudomonadota bacterium]
MTLLKRLSVGAAALALLLGAGAAQAQELKFFRIGTGSAGGTYFPIGGILANAISNPPGSRPCDKGGNCGVPGLVAIAQSTNASAHNCTAVNAGQLEAGLTGAATLFQAYNGVGKFKGKKKPKLRVIANLYPEDLHLVLPKGATLKGGMKDLKGKRVSIFQAGSGTQIAVELFLKELDMTRSDYKPFELNTAQSAERLADGQIDAFFVAGGTPLGGVVQLDSTKGMVLYSFTPEEIAMMNKVLPYYVPSTIPAGTYENYNKATKTVAVNGILITNADQSEDLVYQITKAMWSKTARRLLDNGHAKGKVIRAETALKGIKALGVPLHPGAAKFYKEAGLLK